ncbi:DUF418 domain-containing protein [Sphingomonas sp. GlSt437]|uniref:DUF418 domain-containing protein n=1 Tax=Sphingomonas sp. GlSt437 TaxID=3389970 RepID=UPI003A83AD4D
MTAKPGRIATIDVVRGVAVCGILLMNITAFAMPPAAYDNPRAWGGASGANLAVWVVNFVLVDGKMRGLFSFLFGASILLVADRAEAAGESAWRVHYARMFWLLVLGLAHLWLVWSGDILHHYAIVGSVAFLPRKRSNRFKLVFAAVLLTMQTASYLSLPRVVAQAQRDAAAHPHDRRAQERLADFNDEFGVPSQPALAKDIKIHRSDYPTILADRWAENTLTPFQELAAVGAETLAYMLLGMVALSSGLLTGAWRPRTYALVALGCFAITVAAYAVLAWLAARSGFDVATIAFTTLGASAPLRPIMICGWACLIVLLARRGGWLVRRLETAGRMAFSNYLASSLICTTLFYGYGFGWYGALQRWQLMLVVAAVWALMLAWSQPWLARFRYGPAEWLWRSLARGRPQRLLGSALAEA